MKNSTKIFAVQAILAATVSVIMLSIWFGVFFGEAYPEVRVKETFLPTSCTVVATLVVSSKCCTKSCTSCTHCGTSQTCSSLDIPMNSSSSCCNGYHCCTTCCDTCKSCSNGKCSSYSCNCRCCNSVPDLLCTLSCKECWTPTVTMQYETQAKYTITSNMKKTCNSDYNCVDEYLAQWQVNSTSPCFYNPYNAQEFATSNDYTPYKFGIMYTFAVLTIISVIWFIVVLVIILVLVFRKIGCIKIEFTGGTSHHAAHTNTEPVEMSNVHSTSTPTPVQPTSTLDTKTEPSEVYQPPASTLTTNITGGGFYEPTGSNEQSTEQPYPAGGYDGGQQPYPVNDFNPYQPFNPITNVPSETCEGTQNNDQYVSYAPTIN